jgi:SAM-dependent methyltransferase
VVVEGESASGRLRPSPTDLSYHPLRQLAAALEEEASRVRGATVLDVGCGASPYRPLFTGRYVGVDAAAFHGDPTIVGTGEDLPIRDGAVDVVLSTQNLEHVLDPDRVLREAARVLRPDGQILLSTHGVWVHHPDPHDYWRWTEEGLRELFERNGFVVDRVHHLTEVFLTGLLLAGYPIGATATTRTGVAKAMATAAVLAINALGFALEAAARVLPRHYASIGYLVVARRPAASTRRP